MEIEFDSIKDARNQAKHGVSLADAALMDMAQAIVAADTRFAYGEVRFRALGLIGDALHMMAFTMRGETMRVISLRKANRMEVRRYGKT